MRTPSILASFILVLLSAFVMAQPEYEWEYEAKREIDPVRRIEVKPGVIDTVFAKPDVEAAPLSVRKEVQIQVQPIEAAKIKVTDKLEELYPGYALIGIGNYLMPIGEIYYNGTRSKDFQWGVEAKHHSAWVGDIKEFTQPQFDRTSGDLYGRYLQKRYQIYSRLNYSSHGVSLYGTRDTTQTIDSLRQRFQNFGGLVQFESYPKDSATLNWGLGLEYNNFRDKNRPEFTEDWRARENFVGIYSKFRYKLGKEVYGMNFNIRYNNYKFGILDSTIAANTSGFDIGNVMVNFNPHITHQSLDHKLTAKVGFNLFFDAIDKTEATLAPDIHVQYSLLNNHLLPYVSANGFGVRQNTFRSMAQENLFVRSNQEIRNERNALNFQGGIRGSISEYVSIDGNFSIGVHRNKALFILDTSLVRGNQFQVVYDDMTISALELAVTFQLREKLKIDAVGQLISYQTELNPFAWNLPNYVLNFRASYNLFEKFITRLDFNLQGGRRTREFGPGEGIEQTDLAYHSNLGLLADANLHIEYRYNKRVSAFIQTNNLAAQQYLRWMNYPVYGFQILGGATFRF